MTVLCHLRVLTDAVCILYHVVIVLQMQEGLGYTVLHLIGFPYQWRLSHHVIRGLINSLVLFHHVLYKVLLLLPFLWMLLFVLLVL